MKAINKKNYYQKPSYHLMLTNIQVCLFITVIIRYNYACLTNERPKNPEK